MSCSSPANRCSFALSDSSRSGDEGLERRLVVEPLVLVDLVRTDRRFDRALQFHPGDVAVVVVVRQERVRALGEKRLQRRLGGKAGRLRRRRRRRMRLMLFR